MALQTLFLNFTLKQSRWREAVRVQMGINDIQQAELSGVGGQRWMTRNGTCGTAGGPMR